MRSLVAGAVSWHSTHSIQHLEAFPLNIQCYNEDRGDDQNKNNFKSKVYKIIFYFTFHLNENKIYVGGLHRSFKKHRANQLFCALAGVKYKLT